MTRQFVRFVLVGGFAAAVNVIVRYVLSFRFSFEVAVAIAASIAMVTAFVLYRLLVFDPSGRSVVSEFGWFFLVNVGAIAQLWIVSVVLARWVFPAVSMTYYPLEVAHIIGVVTPIVTSYLGHKYLTFKQAQS